MNDQGQLPELPNLAELPIDPSAEPAEGAPSSVTGQQESDFYKRSGKQWELLENQQNLGVLGKIFGSSTSAPMNIAGLIAILMFLFIVATLFMQSNSDIVEARKIAFGAIASAMSFIFGAATKK